MENQRILLVGFGKISSRIAAALAHGNRVWALARSERKMDDGIHYLQADVTDPATIEH